MKVYQLGKYADDKIYYDHSIKTDQHRSDYYPHAHDNYELIFYKQGNIVYSAEGETYHLSCNDLVITRPFITHEINIDGDGDYERYFILFDENILPFSFLENLPPQHRILHFDKNDSIVGLFDKMDFYCEHLSGEKLKMMLTNLIQEVCVNVTMASESAQENYLSRQNDLVSTAVAYIDHNLLTLNSIEDICRELYVTKSHLHHLFMKHLHVTPKKYITTKRLAMAQREICFGGKPTEVYSKCGFTDYSAFYRAYKSHFGRSPSEKISAANAIISHEDTIPKPMN